jgi:hypothetical protein
MDAPHTDQQNIPPHECALTNNWVDPNQKNCLIWKNLYLTDSKPVEGTAERCAGAPGRRLGHAGHQRLSAGAPGAQACAHVALHT